MTSRERVLTALQHKEPDRVPLFYRDVPEVEQRLLKDLGLGSREELLRYLAIDFRWVEPEYVGPCLADEKTGNTRDIWGVEYRFVEFSEEGGYWEAASNPLAGCEDPAELEDYQWPKLEWFDFSVLADRVKQHAGYAIMTGPGDASPELLGTVQRLCGNEKAWTDMLANPEFFQAMMERITEFKVEFVDKMLAGAGGRIDFFRTGDDYGTQNGLLISTEAYRRLIQPGIRAMSDVAKRHGAYHYHHSCGGIRELIPDLIATGIDVLDPVQVKAAGMVPAELKAEFGEQICFSGGVDEQELLPRGKPEEVRQAVRSLLEVMSPGGGFFLGPTHNLQVDIPTENILAMYQAGRE